MLDDCWPCVCVRKRRVPDLPPRLLTSEVLAYLRVSAATFRRRRRSGAYDIEPVDRGVELLWSAQDVLRIAKANVEPPVQAATITRADHDAAYRKLNPRSRRGLK